MRKHKFLKLVLLTSVGLILILLLMVSSAVIDDSEYWILLRKRHRAEQIQYHIQRVEIGKIQSTEHSEATTGTGLNLLLIDELEQSYLRDLLNCYRKSEQGYYDDYSIRLPVAASCGLHSVESGTYPNGLLDSYLPYTNHVVWNEAYNGAPASSLTLEKFDSSVNAITGHFSGIDDLVNNALTVFQYTNNWGTIGKISKINGAGNSSRSSADHYFYPDVLATNNYFITSFITNTLGIESATTESFSAEWLGAVYAMCHNRGPQGSVNYMFGNFFNSAPRYSTSKSSDEELIQIASSAISFFTDYKKQHQHDAPYANMYVDSQRYTYCVGALVIASDDWYITSGYANMLSNNMGMLQEAWNGYFPDNPKTDEELRALVNSKVSDIMTAIQRKNGVTVSASDCERVYGTTAGYSSYNGAYIFKATDIRSEAYNNQYSDGTIPYVVHVMDYICARESLACSMGDVIYAKQLVLGGLKSVDPTNPDTYYSKFSENSFRPTGDSSWMTAYGVDSSKLSDNQYNTLQAAYSMVNLPNCKYAHTDEVSALNSSLQQTEDMYVSFNNRTTPNYIDCSMMICRIFRDIGYPEFVTATNTTGFIQNYDDYFEVILPNDLQPGDILCYNDNNGHGHAMIYLSGSINSTGVTVIESNIYTNQAYNRDGPNIRILSYPLVLANSTNVQFSARYYCFRPKSYSSTQTKSFSYQ